MIFLRKPESNDISELRSAYENSYDLHQPWTYPPSSFEDYLNQPHRYFVCLNSTNAIVGTINISGVVRGFFHSAYLGYEVFSPYESNGYMKAGLKLILNEAFTALNLHRLEANIQPENLKSIGLVSSLGFVKEGYSKQYLNVGGLGWKDHERWAIINADWQPTTL